jgi:hypothetical protein
MGARGNLIEELEGRTLFSGDVGATLEGGLLRITGDVSANTVYVQRVYEDPNASALEVIGRDGTLINGVSQAGGFRFNGVRALDVQLHDGADEVHVVGLRLQGGMTVDGGAGDDAIYIRKSRILGNTTVRGGHSADALTVAETFFGNDLAVDAIGRAPAFIGFRLRPFGFALLPVGFLRSFADTRGPMSTSLRNTVVSDNLSIVTGPADDQLTMNNCWVEGLSGFDLGDGDDFVSIDNGTEFKEATSLDTGEGDDQVYHEVVRRFDFNSNHGEQGWEFAAANYTLGPGRTLENYGLQSGIREISPRDGAAREGYFLRGENNSDQLFLLINRRFTGQEGLRPDTSYRIDFSITVATNVPSNSFNFDQSLIVGALSRQPEVRLIDEGVPTGRLIGNDGQSRVTFPEELNAVAALKNDRVRELGDESAPFGLVYHEHTLTATTRADAAGRLWLIAGMGSSIESGGAIYFERITVRFRPVA